MNEEAKNSPAPQENSPVQGQPNRPRKAHSRAKRPAWVKKVTVVLAVCALGVAAYLIVPEIASSASLEKIQQDLVDVRGRLSEAVSARSRAEQALEKAKGDLEGAVGRLQVAEADVAAHKVKVTAGEKFIAQLTTKLDEANRVQAETAQQLAAVSKDKAQAESNAAEAKRRTEAMGTELAAAQATALELGEARKSLQSANASLSSELKSTQSHRDNLTRMLDVLSFGNAAALPPKPSSWPGERPVTEKELIAHMGHPSVSFGKGQQMEMKWDSKHSAWLADGIVTQIDGKPVTRALLTSVASHHPKPIPAPGAWRVEQGQDLHYAELVSMFGRPERVAGTGKGFTAWWTIGAWARTVHATVAEGVVTEFDGRPVNPAACCELVRHRAQAYKTASGTVQAEVAAAREFYKRAGGIIGEELAKEAQRLRRDGITLRGWKLAPFESVGTWVARTSALADTTTLRAAVDCTWVALDGEETTMRRFVVLRTVSKPEGLQRAEYAIFVGRE